MLRHLYRCALRLHPPTFRERFADEMLSIFDHQSGKLPALGLMLDCIYSLLRQWILRPQLWIELPAASLIQSPSDDVPSFLTLDTFRPRTSALMHGTVLSLTLFCITGFAIRYSWIHVLHVRIREISFDSDQQVHPKTQYDLRGHSDAQSKPAADSEAARLVSEHLQVDVMPVDQEGTNLAEAMISERGRPAASLSQSSGMTVQLRFEAYVGKYMSTSPRLKILIEIEGEHLSLNIAGHPPRALSPVSQMRFAIAGAENGWVEFTPDDGGKIRGLHLAEAGNLVTAKRQ